MSLSYPLWISRGWPYNKSFIDKACLVNVAGIILNLANIQSSWPHTWSIIQLSPEGEVNTSIYLALWTDPDGG